VEDHTFLGRRTLLCSTPFAIAGMISGCSAGSEKRRPEDKTVARNQAEDVSPAEDLMREHGVLDRILLIYEEGIRRLRDKEELDPGALAGSAKIIQTFIEDYHERLEEDHLFPRFEKAHKLPDLVKTLRQQHQAGRLLTGRIVQLSTAATLKSLEDAASLRRVMEQFIRMYRPHAAREDTVLFPAFRSIVTLDEYDSLGDRFEDEEHKLFGQDGFEKIVQDVSALEMIMGIDDLARFTPA